MVKKEFEFEVEGKKVGFRFNMLAFGKACEIEKCSLDDLFMKLGIGEEGNVNIITMNNLFYAAAINFYEGRGLEIDFKAQDVSDWLDFIGIQSATEMMKEQFKVPEVKNEKALETAGQ